MCFTSTVHRPVISDIVALTEPEIYLVSKPQFFLPKEERRLEVILKSRSLLLTSAIKKENNFFIVSSISW